MKNLFAILAIVVPCGLGVARVAGSEPVPQEQGVRIISPDAYAKVDRALSKRLDFEVKNIPLKKLLVRLADAYEIPIWLDEPSLDLLGISSSTPCTLAIENVRVRDALRLLLQPLELTYTYHNEVLLICPRQDAVQFVHSLVYAFPATYELGDVETLLEEVSAKGSSRGGEKPIIKTLRVAETDGKEFHLFVEADVFTHQRIRKTLALLQAGAAAK